MTNTEYIQNKQMGESVQACVQYDEKPLPLVAVFVSCEGLSAGSD
jgi:hypothetical protein